MRIVIFPIVVPKFVSATMYGQSSSHVIEKLKRFKTDGELLFCNGV